ncbi:MAG: hypothetical protein HRT73_02700 [Flavobacteriales bacterium]|nr:hypothetical protein [Flavobacteriales bacterium]NQX96775.1 hypothetical protein [Flavobacteriales bacterium]
MKYYTLIGDPKKEDVCITHSNLPDEAENEFAKGISFISSFRNKKSVFNYNRKKNKYTDWISGINSGTLISNKFKQILFEDTKDAPFLETYPANLSYGGTSYKDEYYCLNILENIDAMDKNLSDFKYFDLTTVVKSIDKLVLLDQLIEPRNIFKISDLSTRIIVTEILKEKIENNHITGVKCVLLDVFIETIHF